MSEHAPPSPAETFRDAAQSAAESTGAKAAQTAAQSAPSSSTSSSSPWGALYRALWSSDPNPPLVQVESPFGESTAHKRIWRGITKMGGSDELPAVVDILWGLLELWLENPRGRSQSSSSSTSDTDDGLSAAQAEADLEALMRQHESL